MESGLYFSEDLFTNLGKINSIIEKLLIQFIHVLKSSNVSEENKNLIRNEIVDIAKELNAFYSSISLNKITKYDIREIEKNIIDKNTEIIKHIEKIIERVKKNENVIIDTKMQFTISDVINKLGSIKISNEYAITKDKIENLLTVKKFIIAIYNDQFQTSSKDEKQLDKDFLQIKEKTFLEIIRNSTSINPEYYYRSVELIKKLINTGKNVEMGLYEKSNQQMDVLFVKLNDDNSIQYSYFFNGVLLKCSIKKTSTDMNVVYEIKGMISKGTSEVNYSIYYSTVDHKIEQIEHMIGIDYLWSFYEKAYMDYNRKNEDADKRNESLNKNVVDKAIDDLLFG